MLRDDRLGDFCAPNDFGNAKFALSFQHVQNSQTLRMPENAQILRDLVEKIAVSDFFFRTRHKYKY